MITPLDIQNKVFKRSIWGLKPKDVNAFLNDMINDYEKMYKENIEFKDKIGMLSDQIRQYNTMEETLKSTLLIAQKTAEEVSLNARNKADVIVENAEDTGKHIISRAREDVRDIKEEYEHLKKEIFIFKTRYESFMKAQLFSLEDFYKSIEESKEHDFEQVEAISE